MNYSCLSWLHVGEQSREFLKYSREIYDFQFSQIYITFCFAVSYEIIFCVLGLYLV